MHNPAPIPRGLVAASDRVAALRSAFAELKQSYRTSCLLALSFGQRLNEAKTDLDFTDFTPWLKSNWRIIDPDSDCAFESFARNCRRWMELAAKVSAKALADSVPPALPLSACISTPPEDLPADARAARQLIFDFIEGKTIRDCINGIMEGDESHRLTRAINGRTHGGRGKGESADRKAWDTFIRVKLKDITSHLAHWKSFKGTQPENAEKYFGAAVEKWPTPVLEFLRQQINQELKRR